MNSAIALAFALHWRNNGINSSNNEHNHNNNNGVIYTPLIQDDSGMYQQDNRRDTEDIKERLVNGISSDNRSNVNRMLPNRNNNSGSNIQDINNSTQVPCRIIRGITGNVEVELDDVDKFTALIRDLATIKRILAGTGLSSKHGGECRAIDNRAKLIQQIFYTPERDGWTDRNQVFNFLVRECNLPARETNTLLNVIWTTPPSNINTRLRSIAPSYMMTRRNARLDLLDNWDHDSTITQYFYDKEID